MVKRLSVYLASILAAVLLLLGSTTVLAQEQGKLSFHGTTPSSPEEIARAEQKARDVARIVSAREQQLASVQPYTLTKTLSTSGYAPQTTHDLCGPAAAKNLIRNFGKNIPIMEIADKLAYVPGDGTGLGDLWPRTLREYTGYNYVLTWGPSEYTLWQAFFYNIDEGVPFILDVEMKGGRVLPGWPSTTNTRHYVTGNGYIWDMAANLRIGGYFDPYDGRSGTYGQHWLEVSQWVPMTQPLGIVW